MCFVPHNYTTKSFRGKSIYKLPFPPLLSKDSILKWYANHTWCIKQRTILCSANGSFLKEELRHTFIISMTSEKQPNRKGYHVNIIAVQPVKVPFNHLSLSSLVTFIRSYICMVGDGELSLSSCWVTHGSELTIPSRDLDRLSSSSLGNKANEQNEHWGSEQGIIRVELAVKDTLSISQYFG